MVVDLQLLSQHRHFLLQSFVLLDQLQLARLHLDLKDQLLQLKPLPPLPLQLLLQGAELLDVHGALLFDAVVGWLFEDGPFDSVCELQGGGSFVHGRDGGRNADDQPDLARADQRFAEDPGEFGVAHGNVGPGLDGQGLDGKGSTEMQWPSLERLPLMDLSSSSLISFSA